MNPRRLPPTIAVALALFAAAAARGQDDMMSSSAGVVVRDPAYFLDRVLPLLGRECIGCHDTGDPNNKSAHRLIPADDGASWSHDAGKANYENVTALLDRTAPERSRLLLKLTPLAQGGIDHDGGKADGKDFDPSLIDPGGPLVQWVFGATPRAAAPVAIVAPWPRTIERGTELRLDASLSYDPDDSPVTITWEIVEAPLGARAQLGVTEGAKTALTPDRDGPWTVRCRPSDGALGGLPALVRFAVTRPTDAAATPTASAAPIPSATRRLTRALFFDLLGRSPTPDEVAGYAALTHAERVDRLLDAPETWEHWCDDESFYFLLIDRFRPVSDRLAALPTKLRDGLATFRDAHTEFALSAEFNARNPGNDTYVTVVLEQFLGIEVQSEPRLLKEAKRMYDGTKTRIFGELGSNQSDVVHIALGRPEYVDVFCRRMERRYLGVDLPDDEHKIAVERLTLDPLEFRPLLREWLVSDRYAGPDRPARAKNDHQFIRGLFVDLLGRPPALQEFRNMRNALQALTDPAPLRGVLAKVMLDSGAVLPPTGTTGTTGGARTTGGASITGGAGSAGGGAGDSAGGRPADGTNTGAGTGTGARTGRTSDTTGVSAAQVTDLFQRLLGRDPTPDEKSAFLTVLAEPGATWRTAALALLTSPHYQYY